MRYELYYWPGIPGRGEFVRLALEEAGADYVDVERENGGGDDMPSMFELLGGETVARPPFAPPFLRAGRLLIGQTANILLYLGGRHRLAPATEAGRLWTHQLQLTIADFVAEIHDVHHPIAGGLYYNEQRKEARRRAEDFVNNRAPKYLGYFETVLERNGSRGGYMVGARPTYADLSLFNVVAGLRYAFPKMAKRLERSHKRVAALHDRIAERPRIREYLASDRHQDFNQDGIFRYYPELDR